MTVQPAWHKWIGRERLDIVIDSGSSVSMLPQSVAPSHELKPGCGKVYTSASKAQVRERGTKDITLGLMDGTTTPTHWEVGEIHRPLASVSRMAKNGHTVIFKPEEQGGSWIVDSKGKWLKLYLRGGVYVLPAWVEKPSEAQRVAGKSTSATRSAGFPRQGRHSP